MSQQLPASTSHFRLLLRICSYLDPRQQAVLVSVTAASIATGFAATAPAVIVGAIVNRLLEQIKEPSLEWFLIALVVLFAMYAVVRAAAHIALHNVLPQIEVVFRHQQVRHSLQTPVDDDDLRYAAQVNSLLSRGTEATSSLVRLSFGDLVPALVQAAWAIFLAFQQSWIVGATILFATPIGFLIVGRQLRSQSGVRVRIEQEKARLDGALTELLQGKATVRSLNAVDAAAARIRREASSLAEIERKHHRMMGLFDAVKFSVESAFGLVVVLVGVLLAEQGQMSPGAVLTLYLLYSQVAAPMREIHRMRDETNEAIIQTTLMFDLLDAPADAYFSRRVSVQAVDPHAPAIAVSNLTAGYANRDQPAVSQVALSVPPGALVGLCGPTGSGKSTLMKCVAGLLTPRSGTVRLFGRNLQAFDPQTLATDVAYASQSPYLIAGTVRDNVRFGLARDATDQEIMKFLDLAQVGLEIRALSMGLDTPLGEGGLGLSGGQKQRVVLARLLLRRPRILLLDEATSALDNLTELAVMRMVENRDLTVLAIAHRLTTLRNADAVYVMQDGSVVQSGKYADLLAHGGLFEKLVTASERSVVTDARLLATPERA